MGIRTDVVELEWGVNVLKNVKGGVCGDVEVSGV